MKMENNDDEILPFQHKQPKKLNSRERAKKEKRFNSLRRTSSLQDKPRKRLSPVSRKQKKKLAEYRESRPLDGKEACAYCGATDKLEKHHPYGRGGNNITKWIYLCSEQGCGQHHWIHIHPNTAFTFGWLQPEYRGLDPERFPNHPKPWEKGEVNL